MYTVARSVLEQEPDREDDQQWDADCKHRLFHWVAEKIRTEFQETTWQAFWRTAVEGQSFKPDPASPGHWPPFTCAASCCRPCRA